MATVNKVERVVSVELTLTEAEANALSELLYHGVGAIFKGRLGLTLLGNALRDKLGNPRPTVRFDALAHGDILGNR